MLKPEKSALNSIYRQVKTLKFQSESPMTSTFRQKQPAAILITSLSIKVKNPSFPIIIGYYNDRRQTFYKGMTS